LPAFTIVNPKEVEDQAPRFDLSPSLEARFAREPLGLESSGVSYQRLAPGFRIPWGHRHKVQEEVYILLRGSARAKLDDEIIGLRVWDALACRPGRCADSKQARTAPSSSPSGLRPPGRWGPTSSWSRGGGATDAERRPGDLRRGEPTRTSLPERGGERPVGRSPRRSPAELSRCARARRPRGRHRSRRRA
jgi:hypothetical protein